MGSEEREKIHRVREGKCEMRKEGSRNTNPESKREREEKGK